MKNRRYIDYVLVPNKKILKGEDFTTSIDVASEAFSALSAIVDDDENIRVFFEDVDNDLPLPKKSVKIHLIRTGHKVPELSTFITTLTVRAIESNKLTTRHVYYQFI